MMIMLQGHLRRDVYRMKDVRSMLARDAPDFSVGYKHLQMLVGAIRGLDKTMTKNYAKLKATQAAFVEVEEELAQLNGCPGLSRNGKVPLVGHCSSVLSIVLSTSSRRGDGASSPLLSDSIINKTETTNVNEEDVSELSESRTVTVVDRNLEKEEEEVDNHECGRSSAGVKQREGKEGRAGNDGKSCVFEFTAKACGAKRGVGDMGHGSVLSAIFKLPNAKLGAEDGDRSCASMNAAAKECGVKGVIGIKGQGCVSSAIIKLRKAKLGAQNDNRSCTSINAAAKECGGAKGSDSREGQGRVSSAGVKQRETSCGYCEYCAANPSGMSPCTCQYVPQSVLRHMVASKKGMQAEYAATKEARLMNTLAVDIASSEQGNHSVNDRGNRHGSSWKKVTGCVAKKGKKEEKVMEHKSLAICWTKAVKSWVGRMGKKEVDEEYIVREETVNLCVVCQEENPQEVVEKKIKVYPRQKPVNDQ